MEYEDRRDADEAYHDMHNKRMGRDDVLKIEVRSPAASSRPTLGADNVIVGSHPAVRFVAVRPQRAGAWAASVFSSA